MPVDEADETATYECIRCGARIDDAPHQPVACEECGGEMQNISVPRGQ